MSRPPYRALQVALRIFFVLLAIGAPFMIFSSRALVVREFLHPPEVQVSTLLLFLLKEMGGIVLMVSAMLFLASRDPERNVAIVDGLIVGPVILAVTPLLSFYTVDIQRIYPSHLNLGTIGHQAGVRRGFLLLSAATGGALEAGWKFLKNERERQGGETWPGVTPFAFGRA
jgi:hypothetical protein